MADTPPESALIARIAAGDQAALEALAATYHTRLWRYLARQLNGDPDRVEDVLQEVWLAIWRGAGNFRGAARPSTWIYQIAHHQMIDARQAHQRHASYAQPDAPDDDLPGMAIPSHEDAVLNRLDLARALRELAPRHQAALDLVCNHGFTIDEAAGILGIPPGTVKSRLSYARRALLAALRKGAIQ